MLPNPASLSNYGGAKSDYAPVEDPTTDRAASEENESLCDVAAMTRTAPRALVSFTVSGTTCTVGAHEALWGASDAVKPGIVRSSAGVYVITWPAAVLDELGVSRGVNLRFGLGTVGRYGFAGALTSVAGNVATVTCYDIAGHALADPGGSNTVTAIVW